MRKDTVASCVFLVAVTLQVLSPPAVADCQPEWLSGPDRQIPGVGGSVHALTTWDPDGPGPEPELVIVGGRFEVAGDVIASNIAAWDGTRWRPLGTGTNSSVTALTVYNGELIAGGWFTAAGEVEANYIARWDGTQWRPLSSGMDDAVYALNVYNGGLIAGATSRPLEASQRTTSHAGMARSGSHSVLV